MENALKLANKAYSSVPMYIRRSDRILGEGIEGYPLIEKNDVINEESGAIAADAILLYYNEKLIKSRTSGSTGKYMEIYWKQADYARSMLPLWILRKKYYGIYPHDKLCFFYTISEVGNNEGAKIIEENKVGYSKSNLSMERIREIYEEMLEFKPVWLLLQPSMAMLLCRCVKKNNLPIIETLKYIELSGEILRKEVREEIEEVFGCKVANQYGANEFNSIAYECPYGNMHVMTTNVFVEVLDKENKPCMDNEGKIYITTKTNTAMPLIRYGIGDIGKICSRKCTCNSKRPILELTSGRDNDWIETKSGEKKTAYVIVRAIDSANYQLEGMIKQFQIIQEEICKFTIKLVVEEDDVIDIGSIEKLVRDSITDKEIRECQFEFEYFDELFPDVIEGVEEEVRGKFKYFKRGW